MIQPLILYATMTGNTLDAAEELRARLGADADLPARLDPMGMRDPRTLVDERVVLFLTSTFGNGDPPDSAFAFWDILRKADDLDLGSLRFAVAAFGDSSYPRFCRYGEELDERVAARGGRRLAPLVKCDVDWEEPFRGWSEEVLATLNREAKVEENR